MKWHKYICLSVLLTCPTLYHPPQNSWHYEQVKEPRWQFTNLNAGIAEAAKRKKYIFVMYTKPSWCYPCQMMEQNTLPNQKIQDFLKKNYVFVRLKASGKHYPKRGVPDYIWINPYSKKVIKQAPRAGYMSVLEFYKLITTRIKEKKRNEMS